MDEAALARVRAAARREPDSPTAGSGFATRALAATPAVPGWICWMYQQGGAELARFQYHMHYPLDYPRGEAEDWLVLHRALFAERAARGAARARLNGARSVIASSTPELPDDQAFEDLPEGQEWTGRWYSRETAADWGVPELSERLPEPSAVRGLDPHAAM